MRRTGFGVILVGLLVAQEIAYSSANLQEMRKLAAGVRKKCLGETGTTAEIVDAAEIGEFPEDRELKCYFKCILERFNMITKNDKINFKLMKKLIPDHFKVIGLEMIEACNDISGSDRCELSFNFMRCMYNANPVAFFVV